MQNESIDSGIYSNMELTAQAITSLNETRKWATFLSILGFISIGFMILGMVAMLFVGNLIPMPMGSMGAGPIMAISFLIVIAIMFFPVYFLFQFASYAKKAIATRNQGDLETSMGYLRNHYRFMGILAIIFISIYILIFVFAGLAAAFFR